MLYVPLKSGFQPLFSRSNWQYWRNHHQCVFFHVSDIWGILLNLRLHISRQRRTISQISLVEKLSNTKEIVAWQICHLCISALNFTYRVENFPYLWKVAPRRFQYIWDVKTITSKLWIMVWDVTFIILFTMLLWIRKSNSRRKQGIKLQPNRVLPLCIHIH